MTARHVRTPAGPGVAVAVALVALTTAAGCTGPSVPSATLADVGIAPTTTVCPPLQRTPTPTSLPGAATHLVPFAPTSVLLCVYDPLGGDATPAHSLVASRNVTDAMRARQVRDRMIKR